MRFCPLLPIDHQIIVQQLFNGNGEETTTLSWLYVERQSTTAATVYLLGDGGGVLDGVRAIHQHLRLHDGHLLCRSRMCVWVLWRRVCAWRGTRGVTEEEVGSEQAEASDIFLVYVSE